MAMISRKPSPAPRRVRRFSCAFCLDVFETLEAARMHEQRKHGKKIVKLLYNQIPRWPNGEPKP